MPRLLLALALLPATASAVCPNVDVDLGDVIASPASSGTTTGAGDDWPLATCGGGGGAEDLAFAFTAPLDGLYTFSTVGASYDTVLFVVDGVDCSTELACNDDRLGGVESVALASLAAGQEVVLVVDGYTDALGAGTTGDYVLGIRYAPLPECTPDQDLGSAVGTAIASGTTCGAGNDVEGSECGGRQIAEELVFSWTAPASAQYRFSSVGSTYDTAMSLMDLQCTELHCTDDNDVRLAGWLELDLVAGQQVRLSMDGARDGNCGDFVLHIYDTSTCDDDDNDSLCDAVDVCEGWDGAGDADLDAVCDDLDRCVGDDRLGDADADGLCDDVDFSVALGAPVPGATMTMDVVRAPVGKTVTFLVAGSLDLERPTCHRPTGLCTKLKNPVIVGTAVVDATGAAGIVVDVPPGLRPLTNVYVQAVWIDGAVGDTSQLAWRATPY